MQSAVELSSQARTRAAGGPRIAVVITCYNYEHYVQRAIESVQSQNCAACELIVVDDGSTDASWEAIKRMGVRAVRLPNGGQVSACLAGLARTAAPFVLFLDADDELAPGALAKILPQLDSEVAKLQFPLRRIDADGHVLSGGPQPRLVAGRERARLQRRVLRSGVYRSPPTSGNVFRRDVCQVLSEVGYDRATDGVIVFAAPFFGDVVSLGEPLGFYRVHGRNQSGLGSAPSARQFERDINRFRARMHHLRALLRRLGVRRKLARTEHVYYYRELKLGYVLASGGRPRLRDLPGLLLALEMEQMELRRKLGLASFFVLASVLPNARGRALLAYRYSAGARSFGGWLRTIMSSAASSAAP